MSVEIKYKGNTIASASTDTTKTIKTSGKYCEADIEVVNTQDGGGGSLPSVINKLDGGSFTPASDTLVGNYTVSHNLGEVPKGIAVFSDHEGGAYSVETVSSALKVNNTQHYEALTNVSTTGGNNLRGQAITAGSLTATEWYFKRNNTYYKAGVTYKWLAWA